MPVLDPWLVEQYLGAIEETAAGSPQDLAREAQTFRDLVEEHGPAMTSASTVEQLADAVNAMFADSRTAPAVDSFRQWCRSNQ